MAGKKRTVIFLFLSVILIADGIWFLSVYVPARVQRELKTRLKSADVAVGRVFIERPLAIGVSNIRIEGQGYKITVPKTTYDLRRRLTLTSPGLVIKSLPPELRGLFDQAKPSNTSKAPIRVDTVVLNGLNLSIKLPDLSGEILGSAEFDAAGTRLSSARLETALIKSGMLKIKNVTLDLPLGASGKLTIGRLNLEKITASNLQADVVSDEDGIAVRSIGGSWVKGQLSGTARLETRTPFKYSAEVRIADLDLDAFTEDLELKKKMSADGKLTGKINIEGDSSGVHLLEGDFLAGEAGGDLVIQDPNFLKYLSQNTRQPIALVESAFKEYHFDTGRVSLAKKDRDLHFSIGLDGAKGKRDFEINLHDQL
jgi:hypothetical protein